jgi:mannobiose 2-epimerase
MLNKQEAAKLLMENILPFWTGLVDTERGGFFGEADFYGNIQQEAARGSILNSRIGWTFSAAYRAVGDESYKITANHAMDYMRSVFFDRENGGLYWLADADGKILAPHKQFYNIAFGIYACCEHYFATKETESLAFAMRLFDKMEEHGRDTSTGGYIEACGEQWQEVEDFRLSAKDLNAPKSMNTNLHVMEAYTSLLRASGDARVREALHDLVRVTLDKIIYERRTFELFFAMDWQVIPAGISYGHDIEGSWLLYEAALALDEAALIEEVKETALVIAKAVYNAAVDQKNGGLLSGRNAAGVLHNKKEWWPQAEAVVGFYNAFELSGDEKFKQAAESMWKYIINHFTDWEKGDWFNELFMENTPDASMPKAGFWKCPYHNGRMCLEIMRRTT